MCKEYRIPIYSILTGILITLITGLFQNVFLSGVSYWGYFLPWLSKAVYPGATLNVKWVNLFADIVIWSVFIYLALISVEEEEKKKRATRKRPTRKRIARKRRR